jgi:hypothetical protein
MERRIGGDTWPQNRVRRQGRQERHGRVEASGLTGPAAPGCGRWPGVGLRDLVFR